MGTLTEKLDYLKETKDQIKEAIISKGQLVSSSDTFRSYASKIAAIENGDVITATNTTGSDVSVDDKVWIEPQDTDPVTYNIIPSKLVTSTSFTAIAQANIANNASGSVKTILDGNGSYAPTLGTKVITRNNTYSASIDNLYGYSSVTVNVEDIPAVVESLSITPTTSAQSFTPTSGVDGYSPVTVSAVDSSIDANITAGNIKSGVEILGVEGTYSGEAPVLQDKVILANGEYTADEGYDGIGTATVAVNATGATEVAMNRTGVAIAAGDKVWMNQEYYEAGDGKNLTAYNIAYGVISGDRQYVVDSTTRWQKISDLTSNQFNGYANGSKPLVFSDGFTMWKYTDGNNNYGYLYILKQGATKSLTGSSSSATTCVPILSVDGRHYYFDNNTKCVNELDSSLNVIATSNPFNFTARYDAIGIFANGCLIMKTGYYDWIFVQISDLITGTPTSSTSKSPSSDIQSIFNNISGLTSDSKYVVASSGSYVADISDPINPVAANNNFTYANRSMIWYTGSDCGSPTSKQPDTNYPNIISYFYDPSTKQFSNKSYDSNQLTDAGFASVYCIYNDGENTVFSGVRTDGSGYYSGRVAWLSRVLGNYLVNFVSATSQTITGTAAESILAGATGNVYLGDKGALQSKVATSNGTVTPSEGYYGLSKVTVNVVGTGAEVEGKNYTGAVINEGDKVWINPYYYEAGEEIYATAPRYSYLSSSSMTNGNYPPIPTPDFHYCFSNYSDYNFYSIIEDSKVGTSPYITSNWSWFRVIEYVNGIQYIFYASNSSGGMQRTDIGLSWSHEKWQPILGDPSFIIDWSGTEDVLHKIDVDTGQIINSWNLGYKLTSSDSRARYLGFGVNQNQIVLATAVSYNSNALFTLNSDNTITRLDLNVGYLTMDIFAQTSDKSQLIDINLHRIFDVSNLNDIKTISTPFILGSSAYPGWVNFHTNEDLLVIKKVNYASNKLDTYRYNVSTKSWDLISLDFPGSTHNKIAIDVKGDLSSVLYCSSESSVTNVTLEEIGGNNLVNFNLVTANTQTGIATESIATGGIGTVKVGAKITPTGSITITENGTHDVTDYAEAIVNVSDVPAVVESLSITPSTSQQTFTPGTGVDGYAPVNVSAVDSTIDENIVAGNIKKDVTILGVTGTLEEGPQINNQNISVTTDGTYTADSGYTGLGTVTVTAGAVASAATQNEIAEELMLINDGATTFTLTVSPTDATPVITSTTNSVNITPTSSSDGTYVYDISMDSSKSYSYSVSKEGYVTSTGTINGGTASLTVTLVAES